MVGIKHNLYPLNAGEAAKFLGCSIADLIDKLTSFDYSSIPTLTEREEGDTENWVAIRSRYPFTIIVIMDRDRNDIAGYWSFVPVDEKTFKRIKSGTMIDGDIALENIPELKPGSRCYMYITMVFLKKEYRHTDAVGAIYDSFTETFSKFAEKDIFFHEVAANAYTEEGKSFGMRLGMSFVTHSAERGEIYSAKTQLILASKYLNASEKLIKAYSAYP
jgi:hypothetical protein